jgi:hypothetical protein
MCIYIDIHNLMTSMTLTTSNRKLTTLERLITELPDKPWDWGCLSSNPTITFDIVLSNIDKPWEWGCWSSNPSITFDIVLANLDKPWELLYLSENPSITFDIVLANMDKPWNWQYLSLNEFDYHSYFKSETYKKRLVKKINDVIYEDLIAKTWEPTRSMRWCIDEETKHNLISSSTNDNDTQKWKTMMY